MFFKIKQCITVIILCSFSILLTACTPAPNDGGLGNPSYTQQYQDAGNIWDAMSDEFNLPDESPENPAVRQQINWQLSHPGYLKKVAEQAKPYLYYIYQQVRAKGLPTELALLPIIESSYNPFAYSTVGAAGLWQMMPGTASGFGLKVDWWYDGRRDIIASTQSALDYLGYLGNFFHGNWLTAIAAYYAGEGTVATAIQKNLKAGKPIDFWHLPLSTGTRNYVSKLLALATIIKNIDDYPLILPPIKNAPYLTKVDVGSQIDLLHAARLAHVSLEELTRFNPGFNRWATDPQGPHVLLLPIDKAARFKRRLATIPKSKRVSWSRYKVKSGDALLNIAKKYKASVEIIRNVNRLQGNLIHVGQILLIPSSSSTINKIVLKAEKHYFSNPYSFRKIRITNHIVKRGDSLATIAKRYDVQPRQLRFWNGLKNKTKLHPGQKLIIWPPQHYFKHRLYTTIYKVQAGDSLIKIAKRYHLQVSAIKQANHLKHDSLRIHETLKLPGGWLSTKKTAIKKKTHKTKSHHSLLQKLFSETRHKKVTYRIQSGDTLSTIAEKNHVKTTDLKRWNRIDNTNKLKINQVLVIYK